MIKKTVAIRDEIAELELGVLTAKEMDLLFTIFMFIKTTAEEDNKLFLSELKKRAGITLSRARTHEMLQKLYLKLQRMRKIEFNKAAKTISFLPYQIFDTFSWDLDNDFLCCKVHPDKVFLFGNKGNFKSVGRFITFKLSDFISLKHKHSKQIFVLTKSFEQYKHNELKSIYLSDFRNRFNISNHMPYKQIKHDIINKAQKDLREMGIPISIYEGKGFNNRVIKIFFTYGVFDAVPTADMELSDNNTKDTTVSCSDCVPSNNGYTSRADNPDYTSGGFVAIADEDIPF